MTPEQAAERAAEIGIYRERAHLIAHLATQYPAYFAYSDPDEPDWPVIYITTPQGQLSWHIAPDDLDLFPHVPKLGVDEAPLWDGHTTAEKYERLAAVVCGWTPPGVRRVVRLILEPTTDGWSASSPDVTRIADSAPTLDELKSKVNARLDEWLA
ncbi:hypothetical protein ACIBKY_52130 [Nonomuraea sp. NPDC050394]|uniref:WDGH domain-containing protein n=1 Tax=Nonomuraea sp. NPDC050394 TaxID=3364363 RepID=UPI0037B0D781